MVCCVHDKVGRGVRVNVSSRGSLRRPGRRARRAHEHRTRRDRVAGGKPSRDPEKDMRAKATYYWMRVIVIDQVGDPVFHLERGSMGWRSMFDIFGYALGVSGSGLMVVMMIGIGGILLWILPIVLFAGIIMVSFLHSAIIDARPATFEMTGAGVWCRVGDELVEIPWGPDVTANVRTNAGWMNDTHGPLAGLMMGVDTDDIRIDTQNHWSIDGIRRAWPSFMGAVREHGLKMGDDLKAYLEYRREKGLDDHS